VKGRVWRASSGYNHNNNRPLGTLPYTLACTVKSRLGLGSTLDDNGREEGKEASSSAQSGQPSYLYRLRVTCVHLSVLEVASTPPQVDTIRASIPTSYSIKNRNSTEPLVVLLGNAFNPNSLGK
jgi:hypothetical protein